MEDRTISIQSLTVYYRTDGDTKNPPVILLNGWGARVNSFPFNSERVIHELAGHNFYVVSPEHPGLMRSETPKEVWGFEEYAEYLREFIEKLNISSPIIIGQSFGGGVATAYAGKYSDKIKTLVLVCSGLSYDKYLRLFSRFKLYGANFLWILHEKWVPRLIKRWLISTALGVPWENVEGEPYEQRMTMWKIFENWRLPNVYSQIRARTILVWGTQDRLFPISEVRKVLKELPQGELYTVFGGHSVLYTRPREIVNLIVSKL
jgi:pimeloyl-ACP methyl ester carboxylesterase